MGPLPWDGIGVTGGEEQAVKNSTVECRSGLGEEGRRAAPRLHAPLWDCTCQILQGAIAPEGYLYSRIICRAARGTGTKMSIASLGAYVFFYRALPKEPCVELVAFPRLLL